MMEFMVILLNFIRVTLWIGCKKNGKSWIFLGFNDGLMGFNGDLAGL
jgi:hypothetical protein